MLQKNTWRLTDGYNSADGSEDSPVAAVMDIDEAGVSKATAAADVDSKVEHIQTADVGVNKDLLLFSKN